jgi:hypothetical protein
MVRKIRELDRVVRLLSAILWFSLFVTVPSFGTGNAHASGVVPAGPTGLSASGTLTLTIGDGQEIQADFNSTNTSLADQIHEGSNNGTSRSYSIQLEAAMALPGVNLTLTTSPLRQWEDPTQFPGGPDLLPGLEYWSWNVQRGGFNDSRNWTLESSSGMLERTVSWQNATYVVEGTANSTVSVSVDPNQLDGTYSPGIGLSLNGAPFGNWGAKGLANLTKIVRPMNSTVARFGITTLGTLVGWNNTTNQPEYNFSTFDRAASFARGLNESILLTLPVGTWGDGNSLPAGMPLNFSALVTFAGTTGYLPTPASYLSFIEGLVNHTAAIGEFVQYWSIGNEMPLPNASIVGAYIQVFNAAEQVINSRSAASLVGSDVMTTKQYLPTFAADAHGVGFLSFHFYPSSALTFVNGSYAPPNGTDGAYTDPQLWTNGTNLSASHTFLPPTVAQQEWFNLTGDHLPILDAETNMNSIGGLPTEPNGSDPRLQNSFAASWLAATLMDAARENVSVLTYFTLTEESLPRSTITSNYGGWGLGMTEVTPTSGATTIFAPFWALQLWGSYLPPGSPGVQTNVSDPNVLRAFAVRTSNGTALALASGVNTTVNVEVHMLDGRDQNSSGSILDGTSYVERYSPVNNSTTLYKSGILPVSDNSTDGTLGVQIHGYGVCVLRIESGNSTSGTGNGSSGNSSSGNSSSGNSSGNSSTGQGPPPNGTGGGGNGQGGNGSSSSSTGNETNSSSGAGRSDPSPSLPDNLTNSSLPTEGAVKSPSALTSAVWTAVMALGTGGLVLAFAVGTLMGILVRPARGSGRSRQSPRPATPPSRSSVKRPRPAR